MLSDKMLKGLNDQITKEIYSSYLYLQMVAWFQNHSLSGFANWMKVQTQEELSHAMILFNFVNERDGFVTLGAVDKPESKFDSVQDVFTKTLAHEQLVTASINNLVTIAIAEQDYATKNRLDWFVDEQVEEEANATELLGKLKLIGNDGNGLFMMDKEVSARAFVMPSPLAGA